MSPSANPPPRTPALARAIRRRLAHLLGAAAAALLALLALLAGAETVAWTFFERSWAAAQEIQALLLIWLALLGAAWGVAERFHIAVTLVADRLPATLRPWAARLAPALTSAFGTLLAIHGADLVGRVRNTLPGTGWPAALQYLPVAVGGALIALLALVELLAVEAPKPGSEPGPTGVQGGT